MEYIGNGLFRIENIRTGEKRVVKKNELSNYGLSADKGFLGNLISGLTEPITETGRTMVAGAVQAPLYSMAAKAKQAQYGEGTPEFLRPFAGTLSKGYESIGKTLEPIAYTPERYQRVSERPMEELTGQAGRSLQLGAYGIPAGRGWGALTQGAKIGGTYSAGSQLAEEGQISPAQVGMGALFGAGTAGLIEGAGALKGMVGKGLAKKGETLATKTIRPSKTQSFKFEKQYKTSVPKVLQKYNLIGKDATQIMDDAILPRQQQFDSIVEMSGLKVSKNEVVKQFNKILRVLKQSTSEDDKRLASQLIVEMNNVLNKAKGGSFDISKLTKFRINYDGKVSGWIGNPIDAGKNRLAANALRRSIQSTVDKLGIKTPNGLSLKEAGLELSKLYGVHDLAALQQNLGKGNLPMGLLQLLGIGTGGILGNVPGAVAGYAATQAANAPQVISALSKGATAASGLLQKQLPQSANEIIRKLATVGASQAGRPSPIPIQGGQEDQYKDDYQLDQVAESIPQENNFVQNEDGSWSPRTTAPSEGVSGFPSKEQFQQAMFEAAQTGDERFTELQSVYKLLYPEEEGLSTDQKKRRTIIQQAGPVLKRVVEVALQAPSGAAGSFLSTIGKIPGVAGGPAEYLRRDTEGFARLIASAFASEVGVATDRDVERWLNLMPRPGDTMGERRRQSQALISQIVAEAQTLGIDVPPSIIETAQMLGQ